MTTTWTTELIRVTSSAITAFESAPTSTLNVGVWFNCSKVATIVITSENKAEYIFAEKLHLLPEMVGTSEFGNGVYKIYLQNVNGTTITEDTGLLYIDTGINCKLVDYFAQYEECLKNTPCEDNYQFWAFSFHYLLKNLTWCDEVTYTNACQLFTTLNDLINKEYDCECKG